MNQRTNSMALASMILGIMGLTALPFIGSLLAVIFGYQGRSQIRNSNGAETGDGMALSGIILGWIGLGLIPLILILFFSFLTVPFIIS